MRNYIQLTTVDSIDKPTDPIKVPIPDELDIILSLENNSKSVKLYQIYKEWFTLNQKIDDGDLGIF